MNPYLGKLAQIEHGGGGVAVQVVDAAWEHLAALSRGLALLLKHCWSACGCARTRCWRRCPPARDTEDPSVRLVACSAALCVSRF